MARARDSRESLSPWIFKVAGGEGRGASKAELPAIINLHPKRFWRDEDKTKQLCDNTTCLISLVLGSKQMHYIK